MHPEEPTGGWQDPRYDPTWARRFLVIVLAALSIGAVANIAMEASYKAETRALMIHDGGSLSDTTATEQSRSRGRYWLASILHDNAFGGVLVVPDAGLIGPYRFENLADIEVVVEDYDPTLTAGEVESLEGLPTLDGYGNIIGLFDFKPFRVVWSPDGTPVPVFRLWYFGNTMYFIDDRVLTVEANQ